MTGVQTCALPICFPVTIEELGARNVEVIGNIKLAQLPQKVLVVMEAELWFMLFLVAKKRGAKTFLINARISDKSYNSYKRFSFFYKKIFENIDKVFAQSEIDKIRLEELGARNVEVIGNIKLAQLPQKKLDFIKPNCTVITAASTHENEEDLILKSYKKEFGKLIIVPRHPERFNKVDLLINEFIKDKNITYHRYRMKEDFDSDIIMVDKMGRLNIFFPLINLQPKKAGSIGLCPPIFSNAPPKTTTSEIE